MKGEISTIQLPIVDLNVIQNKIYFIRNQYVMLLVLLWRNCNLQ